MLFRQIWISVLTDIRNRGTRALVWKNIDSWIWGVPGMET